MTTRLQPRFSYADSSTSVSEYTCYLGIFTKVFIFGENIGAICLRKRVFRR